MKRCLWMIFMVVGICMLTGCISDDDKLDSLPWNDKELFNRKRLRIYTIVIFSFVRTFAP